MPDLVIYRKRLIPFENIPLKGDTVLFADEHAMVTKWNTINPRKDIDHGYSLYLPDEGFKISKFLKIDGTLHKWYCDIVEFYFDKERKKGSFGIRAFCHGRFRGAFKTCIGN